MSEVKRPQHATAFKAAAAQSLRGLHSQAATRAGHLVLPPAPQDATRAEICVLVEHLATLAQTPGCTSNFLLSTQAAMMFFLTVLFSALSPPAARAAGPVIPGAGSILNQIAPLTPPTAQSDELGLTIGQPDKPSLPSSASFLVQQIEITGNTLLGAASLQALVADAQGQSLNLVQLGEIAARITQYCQISGYPLTRAIVPAQTIASGIVRIEVIEARYGEIKLENSSRVKDALLQATLFPLQSSQHISQRALDKALLLISDIPGVMVNATLEPGAQVRTADLLVSTAPGPRITGSVVLDNDGNRYTGRTRIGATASLINPLQHGDVLTLSSLSTGAGLNYTRLSYETLLNAGGTRLGGAYSSLHYRLGEPLAALQASGSAQVASLWARHALLRSRDLNLYGQLQLDRLQLRDHIDASAIQTDRHLGSWTMSLAGDARDTLLMGGVTTWALGWTVGRVGFDNQTAQLVDAGSANTQGGYSKRNATITRLQSLSPRNALYLAITGQWGSRNLDASQKMAAGGPYAVRAYDAGAVSGDTAYLATAELRHDLGMAGGHSWQALVFVDSALTTVNKNPWTAGVNRATVSGAGVGLIWTGSTHWRAKAMVAARSGPNTALVANGASTHAWVELKRMF